MTTKKELTPEMLADLVQVADKLEKVKISPEYKMALNTFVGMQKDMFEMLDRNLTIMQSVHSAELKINEFYMGLVKFLLPIFATAAITGATINIQNINSVVLFWTGVIGVILLIFATVLLVIGRRKKAVRQKKEYEKLSEVAKDWQQMANIQKAAMNQYAPSEDMRRTMTSFMQLMDKCKNSGSKKK